MSIGTPTSDALSSIGSDLSFAVSFAIANELLGAAKEAQIDDSELVGIVLLFSVFTSTMPKMLYFIGTKILERAPAFLKGTRKDEASAKEEKKGAPSGLIGFMTFVLTILQRITLTVTIQLVTASISSSQPLRSSRILSLMSCLFFFVFLRQVSAVGSG